MADRSVYPSEDELDELEDVMERAGVPDDRVEKMVRVAAVDMDLYERMRRIYQQKAAQHREKDPYFQYEEYRGELLLGSDPDGRPLGVSRRHLNEHMLVTGRTAPGVATPWSGRRSRITV